VHRPLAFAVSRWWDDPWARGAWSLLRPGATANTRAALGTPVGTRLILAGEATHPSQAGMTHGAFDEGGRAAQWALDAQHRHVVVVGAGAAGLGAARALADAGAHVTIMEARDRIGGRVHSVPLAGGVMVECGANWLQQGSRNTLAPLADALGLRLVDTDFREPLDIHLDGGATPPNTGPIISALRQRFDDQPPQASIADALAEPLPFPPDAVRRVVDLDICLDAGAPLADLSAKFGFEAGVGEGDRWIVGGYSQLLSYLADGLDIRFESPVSSIVTDDAGVLIDGNRADAAIVTVPVAVLRSGSITFDPPLPAAHREALAHITAGRVEKAALQFSDRFWPVAPSNYLRISEGRAGCVSEWLDLTDVVGTPTITSIFVGDWLAEMWDGHPDHEVADAAAAVLRRASTIPAA
jgi:monoamine oxidase